MNKDNKNKEVNNTDKKLHISDVINSIDKNDNERQRMCKREKRIYLPDGKYLKGEIGYDVLTCISCFKKW